MSTHYSPLNKLTPLEELVDIVDVCNRPLAVLPLILVHRQSLLHRSVFVLIFDHRQRLFLQKRSQKKTYCPGCYDLSATGHVRAGEATEEAAMRELKDKLGLTAKRLVLRNEIPASPATRYEFVSFFFAGQVAGVLTFNPNEIEGGMYVDFIELAYLTMHFRELLTPTLIYAWENVMIFSLQQVTANTNMTV
ncbi:isopentenyl-diphosphate Delta-isomerase [Desulfovibrionales bacterium]